MHEINHIMYVFVYHISNMYTPILKYVLQLFTTTKKFSDEFFIKMNHNHNISSSHTFGALFTTRVRSRASCCLLGRCTASRTIASASISAMKAASAASRLCRSSGDMSNRRPPLRSLGSTEYFFGGGPSRTTLAYILYASPSSFSESWTGKSTWRGPLGPAMGLYKKYTNSMKTKFVGYTYVVWYGTYYILWGLWN
jgi:hypothetical protein